jgi:DNA-binding NarL/FixJ family response regulator
MKKITVLLVDDHVVVRQGLRALLEAEADIEIVGEAQDGRQAITMAKEKSPELVVMDVAMPTLNGVESVRQILRSCPRTRVVALSSYTNEECVEQMLKAGAAGYLTKQTASTELSRAIREVRCGRQFFSPAIVKLLRERGFGTSNRSFAGNQLKELTAREKEVLKLVAEGFSNKEAATQLGISIKTIEKHRQQVMNKLNIHETAGLTRYALAHRVVAGERLPNGSPGDGFSSGERAKSPEVEDPNLAIAHN